MTVGSDNVYSDRWCPSHSICEYNTSLVVAGDPVVLSYPTIGSISLLATLWWTSSPMIHTRQLYLHANPLGQVLVISGFQDNSLLTRISLSISNANLDGKYGDHGGGPIYLVDSLFLHASEAVKFWSRMYTERPAVFSPRVLYLIHHFGDSAVLTFCFIGVCDHPRCNNRTSYTFHQRRLVTCYLFVEFSNYFQSYTSDAIWTYLSCNGLRTWDYMHSRSLGVGSLPGRFPCTSMYILIHYPFTFVDSFFLALISTINQLYTPQNHIFVWLTTQKSGMMLVQEPDSCRFLVLGKLIVFPIIAFQSYAWVSSTYDPSLIPSIFSILWASLISDWRSREAMFAIFEFRIHLRTIQIPLYGNYAVFGAITH